MFTIQVENWHDDVIKWKDFPRYWPFVRGIHRSPVNSPHKGQWCRALMVLFLFLFFSYSVLNKRLSKQSRGWWFETPSRPLWRHCNDNNWGDDQSTESRRHIINCCGIDPRYPVIWRYSIGCGAVTAKCRVRWRHWRLRGCEAWFGEREKYRQRAVICCATVTSRCREKWRHWVISTAIPPRGRINSRHWVLRRVLRCRVVWG